VKEDLPYPNGAKRKRRLPVILSQEEVTRIIDSSKNLFHYTMLLTMYSAGLRRSELCRLKVANIDSQRMMLRVERGKGDVDREVPISQKLVETLREYWRWMRPQTYMFPGTADGWRADKPITSKVVWRPCSMQPGGPASKSASLRIRCGTALQPTCSKVARICAPFRF
jgi:integrase/recombinase XerD